jgi:outer membrane protein OmpA-like peptidoglycan-associated protein
MKNGCPPEPPKPLPKPDRDGDGVPDADDACPDEPGYPEAKGCPRAKVDVAAKQIRIMQRIEFEYRKATLRPESTAVLEAVAAILEEHPHIKLVEIQGHTDNIGGSDYNLDLSKRRAEAVRKWLIDHGIASERLQTVGYGEDRPLESNDAPEGRQNNRRVEFHIKGGGQGEPGSEPPPAAAPR